MSERELSEEPKQVEPELDLSDAAKPESGDEAEVKTEVSDEKQESRWRLAWEWLTSTTKGRVTLGVAAAVLVSGGAIAATDAKYAVVGVAYRNQTTVTVLDKETKQPLPGATVMLGGETAISGKDGKTEITHLQLGKSTLKVTKKAYKTFEQPQLVPIGKLEVPVVQLESEGVALAFSITDKISGLPIDGAEISAGDISTISEDGEGRIVLMPGGGRNVTAKVTKKGYLDGELKLDLNKVGQKFTATLVPAGKVYYFSNRSGRLDLYSSNLDGSGEEVALRASGSETAEIGLLPSIEDPDLVAIVSTREGRRDSTGSLQSDLFIFDGETKQARKIDSGVYFNNYRAWVGDTLVYEQQGQGCASVKTYRPSNGQTGKLFACSEGRSAKINIAYDNALFYSVFAPTDPNLQGLYTVRNDGKNNRRVNDNPAYDLTRQVKDTINAVYYNYNLPKPEMWTSINIENLKVTKLDNAPTNRNYRAYVESPDEKTACFIEERDGKSELYLTDHDGKNERKLTNFGSASQFVQWHGDNIVFSSTKSNENALYVVSVKGGEPKKIADFYRGNLRTYGGGYNPNYY